MIKLAEKREFVSQVLRTLEVSRTKTQHLQGYRVFIPDQMGLIYRADGPCTQFSTYYVSSIDDPRAHPSNSPIYAIWREKGV